MKPIETVMRVSPVIPVLVIEDIAHARPVARTPPLFADPSLLVTRQHPRRPVRPARTIE